MRIILAGSIGRFPVAGHAWINLHYLRGFAALGHEVFYLEDCGEESWVYHWDTQQFTTDLDYPAGFVQRALDPVGLAGRWIYRAGDRSIGMSIKQMREVCRSADMLLIRGAPLPKWRDEYMLPRRRVFLDVDPVFTQITAAQPRSSLRRTIDRCHVLFTIGRHIGWSDCPVPNLGRIWHKTVSPVYLPEWPMQPAIDGTPTFTTIMQWASYKAVNYHGVYYGNKSRELPRFADVARCVPEAAFEIAMTGLPPEEVDMSGWRIVSGQSVSDTTNDYRRYIQGSFAEFSVAKHGYVAANSGWFSDRSACYLASGRPVIVQDTGLADWLPVGEGVLTFASPDDAVDRLRQSLGDRRRHGRAARELAEEFFDSDKVLNRLLENAFVSPKTGNRSISRPRGVEYSG